MRNAAALIFLSYLAEESVSRVFCPWIMVETCIAEKLTIMPAPPFSVTDFSFHSSQILDVL